MNENGHANGRRKRPNPAREQPIRNWSTLFGPAKAAVDHGGVPEDDREARDFSSDAVSHGVKTGYKVIDEYLRRGQVSASATSSVDESDPAAATTPAKLTERMFQYASDLASVWLELMQTMMVGTMPPGGRQGDSAGPFKSGGVGSETAPKESVASHFHAAHDGPRAFTVEIDSKRPLSISWELGMENQAEELSVHPPRAVQPDIPPLSDVAVERKSSPARMTICVRVSDEQPAGSYSGVIVNRLSNVPVGTLLVTILP